jgi:hypothetical protein
VWGRLHTGSSPAIRTIEQPRDQLPGAVFFSVAWPLKSRSAEKNIVARA